MIRTLHSKIALIEDKNVRTVQRAQLFVAHLRFLRDLFSYPDFRNSGPEAFVGSSGKFCENAIMPGRQREKIRKLLAAHCE